MLVRGSIREAVTTRRTAMWVRATPVLAITMAVRATTMEDQDIHITATIHPGRLHPMGTTPIHTMGVIRIHITEVIAPVTPTTSQDT